MQRYGSLRHRADLRLDAMAQVIVHAHICGMEDEPTQQMLDLITWDGVGQSCFLVTVEDTLVRFVLLDEHGETESVTEVALGDYDAICDATETGVDFLLSLG